MYIYGNVLHPFIPYCCVVVMLSVQFSFLFSFVAIRTKLKNIRSDDDDEEKLRENNDDWNFF